MPSSDYTNAVGGGLKLKGAKDAGVKKPKKKKPKPDANASKAPDAEKAQEPNDETSTALQKALADEEETADNAQEADRVVKTDRDAIAGKTEAQRKHDDIRRRRVRE